MAIATINGIPVDQWNEQSRLWQDACRVVNLDASMFDLVKLIGTIADQTWMRQCEIVPDYMPPFPTADTKPTCVVRWRDPRGSKSDDPEHRYTYLRYSQGPRQGTFWDIYGDDFHSPELALVMLSQSQPPSGCVFNFMAR